MRMVTPNLSFERAQSRPVFYWAQFVDPRTAPADNIGEPQPPFRQSPILPIGERLVHQAGFEEEFPETVGGACKMVSNGGRPYPWIDPNKQDARSWAQVVWEMP